MFAPLTIIGWGMLAILPSQSAPPQNAESQIQVHALDGRTGKPISNEHVLIFVTDDPENPKARLIDRSTDARGIVAIQNVDFRYLQVFVDWHILCVKHPNNKLEYTASEVVNKGVISSDSCGKVKVNLQPGDLYIFTRPRHWWEPTSGANVSDAKRKSGTMLLTSFTP